MLYFVRVDSVAGDLGSTCSWSVLTPCPGLPGPNWPESARPPVCLYASCRQSWMSSLAGCMRISSGRSSRRGARMPRLTPPPALGRQGHQHQQKACLSARPTRISRLSRVHSSNVKHHRQRWRGVIASGSHKSTAIGNQPPSLPRLPLKKERMSTCFRSAPLRRRCGSGCERCCCNCRCG